ncbi:hypothetical protein G7Y89_g5190 [Cudoniella acicularis]|uniref:Uncharacterized protein n=1 Tax=Cudoniella acicularis TaxID=354080 RepID=A0A8H4RQ08_9HELO|nr:hypothetical protein G7Y89_g5190 [Cudoniella acicularis]
MYGNTIRRFNGYDQSAYTYYPIVMIGAGESSIAMGCRLKEALSFDQFRIFERQSGIGGTWWINRYPGVACDIPAVFYSFSFCQNPNWTTFYPKGHEIAKYLQDACNKYGLIDKIQLNTEVRECKWLESEQVWEVTLQHLVTGVGDLSEYDRAQKIKEQGSQSVFVAQEKIRAKIVISGVGGLVEPKAWPEDIPGKDSFDGEIFHSARWRYDVDLEGKDIIVVGTGCSAAQLVPQLVNEYKAKSVTQLMRSPPWVGAKHIPSLGKKGWEERAPWLNNNIPLFMKYTRLMSGWPLFGTEPHNIKARAKAEKAMLDHMKATVPSKYHEILTPNYGVGCKRRIFDDTWFPALNDPRLELTTMPLKSISSKAVTLGPGRTYPEGQDSKMPEGEVTLPADVIILANGFETTQFLHPLDVTGRGGAKINEIWADRGGPQMYMSTAIDGFPNFFMLYGPNTGTGHTSVILASENAINLILNFIKPIIEGDATTVEVKKEAELKYTKDLQSALKKTVWNDPGCRSWYKTSDGWNSNTYPYSQFNFWLRCAFPTWSDWDIKYTRKGLMKRRTVALLKIFSVFAAVTGFLRLARCGIDVTALVKHQARLAFLTGAGLLQKVASKF